MAMAAAAGCYTSSFLFSRLPSPWNKSHVQRHDINLAVAVRRRRRRRVIAVNAVPTTAVTAEEMRWQAAQKAVEFVQYRMVVGLGHGAVASLAVDALSRMCKIGRIVDIVVVPTSKRARQHATALGIPVAGLHQRPRVDVTIDSVDAVDSDLNFVAGAASAASSPGDDVGDVVRRKMLYSASQKLVLVVDESKLVNDGLVGGEGCVALPVEVVPFSCKYNARRLESVFQAQGCRATLRMDGVDKPFLTDDRNYILDLHFASPIGDYRRGNQFSLNNLDEHQTLVGMGPPRSASCGANPQELDEEVFRGKGDRWHVSSTGEGAPFPWGLGLCSQNHCFQKSKIAMN